MIKILKNNTASAINLDIGITVPASSQVTLATQDYDEAAASDDIVTEVGSGNITINDGSNDLSISDGIRLIQGGYTNKIQLDEDLLNSDRIKIDVTGSLGDNQVKVSANDSLTGFLEDKIVAENNKVSVTTLNDGSDEDIQIGINPSNIGTSELTNDEGFLTESTHDSLPADNPHSVTKGQIGLGSVDNTSDADKQISTATQTALDLKYDASNPNGYETPAELNARDTANRSRSNHTGTQLAATISDLSAAITAGETTTSLTLSSNILTYIDENGTSTNIDLSLYLDDTNLARIVSGVLNPTTGIVTFTRDDSTTFTIDFSPLLDNQTASEVPVTPTGNLTSTDVQAALEELQSDVDDLDLEDTNLQTQITTNTGNISTNTGNISTNTGNISTNSSSISTNTGNISTNTTNISTNTGNISTNTSNISTNTSDISTLTSSQATQDSAIALNTAKVSADGSIDTHSDVDTTTASPTTGSQLTWDGSNWVPKSIDNGFTIFPIWAEESGGLSDNNRQWSFGNGATGATNITMAFDCEVFAMTLDAENSGTSISIELMRENGAVTSQTFTGSSGVANFTAIPFAAGERLGFQTDVETGAYSDVRVCAWCRVSSTAAFPTPDRSVVSNSSVAFTSTTFTTIPSLTTTVTINDTGTVDGNLIYSALRSGGTNSEAMFRVVINGTNGLVFNDTLSTFNDTGGASFFVESLPAGTYTVSAEASVSEPISITSCQLTAVGVED